MTRVSVEPVTVNQSRRKSAPLPVWPRCRLTKLMTLIWCCFFALILLVLNIATFFVYEAMQSKSI